ncbi:MAG: Flp pilus assembly protein CpaB [Desulfovibrio sp.]
MTRTTKVALQLTLALLLSVGAGFLVLNQMSAEPQQGAAAPQVKTQDIVVAKEEILRGSTIRLEQLQLRAYAEENLPDGAFFNTKELVGRVLKSTLGPNDPVTERRLASRKVLGGGVSSLITPGKRAMSVKGNAVMGLSGFVRAGDRVDVLVSLTVGENEKPVTKLVLEHIKVLATGTQVEPPEIGNDATPTAPVDVYTLELTPVESERLALAATQGTLNFALRNTLDKKTVLTRGATVHSTLAAYTEPKKPKAKRKPRPVIKVEVINGSDKKTLKF